MAASSSSTEKGWGAWLGQVAYDTAQQVWNGETRETKKALPRELFVPPPKRPPPKESYLTHQFTQLSTEDFEHAALVRDWVLNGEVGRSPLPVSKQTLNRIVRDSCFDRWADYSFAPDISVNGRISAAMEGPSLGWQLIWTFQARAWKGMEDFSLFHKTLSQHPDVGAAVPMTALLSMEPIDDIVKTKEELAKLVVMVEWEGCWRYAKVVGTPYIVPGYHSSQLRYQVTISNKEETVVKAPHEIGVITAMRSNFKIPSIDNADRVVGYAGRLDDPDFVAIKFGTHLKAFQESICRLWASEQVMDCKAVDVKLREELLPLLYSKESIAQKCKVEWARVWNAYFAQHGLTMSPEDDLLALALWRAYMATRDNYTSEEGFQRFVNYHSGMIKPAVWTANLMAPYWMLQQVSFPSQDTLEELKLKKGQVVLYIHQQGGTVRLARFEGWNSDQLLLKVIEDRDCDSLGSREVGPIYKSFNPGTVGVLTRR